MLLELNIRDFAIIDRLHLELDPAFNVLTGETGAGKSIIIDALGTLRGEKVDTSFVRAGSTSARVEGVFALADCADIVPVLQEYDLYDEDDDQVIVAREINGQTGRSVARINGRAVNSATLREIGGRLVDIHGQHEGVSLFNTRTHLDILDRYGNLLGLREEVGLIVDQLRSVRTQLDELRRSEARRQDRIEELQYQIEEIEAAKLRPGEEEELARERKVLQNASKITGLVNNTYTLLDRNIGRARRRPGGRRRSEQSRDAVGRTPALRFRRRRHARTGQRCAVSGWKTSRLRCAITAKGSTSTPDVARRSRNASSCSETYSASMVARSRRC